MNMLPLLVACLALFADGIAQTLQAPLVGVVVDDKGQPVLDAKVEVFRGEGRGFSCLDLAYRHSWLRLAATGVDKRGRFGLQLPVGLMLRVQVRHPSFALWRRDDRVPGDDLRIELQPPCTFRGQLVRAGTGEAAVGTLRAWNEERTEVLDGRTDAQGRFEFTHLPAGKFTCRVEPDLLMSPPWFHGELVAKAPVEQRFELQPGVLLRGRVTDAATGLPIAGACIGENWTLDKLVRTGADGTYALRGYGQKGAPTLTCLADGYARTSVARPDPLADPTTMDFALERGIPVTGTVLDPAGKPQAGVYVAAIGVVQGEITWLPRRTGADGQFRIDGLDRNGDVHLMVRCDGFASTVYHLPAPNAHGRIEVGELRLQAANVVRGIVRDGEGKPVARAQVRLTGSNGDRERLARQPGSWNKIDFYLADRQARSDASGNFAFGDVPVGKFLLGPDAKQPLVPGNAIEIEVTAKGPPPPVEIVR